MSRQHPVRTITFWALCAWCAWVLAVRSEEPQDPRIVFEIVPTAVPVVESSTAQATVVQVDQRVVAPKKQLTDVATGQPLQGMPSPYWQAPTPATPETARLCVRILLQSGIDADRRRALAILERTPAWPVVPGAIDAIRRVVVAEYDVSMRSTALRMLTTTNLPANAVVPTLLATARFDGSPELRSYAKTMLAPFVPSPMDWELARVSALSGRRIGQ